MPGSGDRVVQTDPTLSVFLEQRAVVLAVWKGQETLPQGSEDLQSVLGKEACGKVCRRQSGKKGLANRRFLRACKCELCGLKAGKGNNGNNGGNRSS